MASALNDEDPPEERRMTFFEHLEELRARLKRVVIAFLVAFIITLTFSFQPVDLGGTTVWLPLPTLQQNETIPAQLFQVLNESLVQGSARIIVTSAPEAVVIQLKVAMFLAVILTSPVMTVEFWRFVAPGLKPKERRLIFRLTAPVVILFVAGVLMSLLVVLPFTFPFLYTFARGLGAEPLLTVEAFLDFVVMFSLGFGLAFELPVVMYGLSYLGIVQPDFWKKNWRYAAIAIFIFGAVITPDGSGITMMLVALQMLVLYAAGYAAIVLRSRRGTGAKSS